MARRKKSQTVEANGVRVRVFKRGGRYWLDVRHGITRKRVSAETADRSTADANALKLAREIAVQQLTGVTPDTLTLGQLFRLYDDHKAPELVGQWQRGVETRERQFLTAWDAEIPVASISQSSVDGYCRARRAAFREQQERKHREREELEAKRAEREGRKPTISAPVFRPLRDGALACDFRWLSSVLNWARKHKLPTGKRLLDYNPLHDCTWPKEKNVRRPIASHERYERTVAKADEVDSRGRLRVILTLARYTGRRESAILQLRANDILRTKDQIAKALAAAGMDERQAEHMPHGAIRWSAETDKMGILHITPVSQTVRAELDRYLTNNPRIGDAPLFPMPEDDARPMRRDVAAKWLLRAEKLAELPKLVGGIFHPYRRLWATERKHFSDKDVARAGGWKDVQALKLSYQQSDPATVLAVVVNGG